MWNYSNPMNLNFFFRFQLSILNLLEMKLCKFFYLFFYEVIPSHDLGDKFNRLIHANLSCFFIFFFRFHLFIIGLVGKSGFLFYLFLLFMRLYWSNDPSRWYDGLTWVGSIHFFECVFNWIVFFNWAS